MCNQLTVLHTMVNDYVCNLSVLIVAPSKPRSLKVVSVNSSSITLQWMTPETPNGIITQYSLQFDATVINFSSNMLMYTVSGLLPETIYSLQVKAHTSAGAGQPSDMTVTTRKLLNIVYVYMCIVPCT